MSGHYRLRPTRDSAFRLAEWRLARERRHVANGHREPQPPPPRKRRHLGRLVFFWIVVGVLVWLAIELSQLDWVARPVEIALGFLLVAIATSLLIAALAALTFWRPQTRSQRAGGGA